MSTRACSTSPPLGACGSTSSTLRSLPGLALGLARADPLRAAGRRVRLLRARAPQARDPRPARLLVSALPGRVVAPRRRARRRIPSGGLRPPRGSLPDPVPAARPRGDGRDEQAQQLRHGPLWPGRRLALPLGEAPRLARALGWRAAASPGTPSVGVTARTRRRAARTAEVDAFARSVRWFREQVVYSVDSKKGALEGFESPIDHRGRQMRRASLRADCSAETALVFACDWAVRGDPSEPGSRGGAPRHRLVVARLRPGRSGAAQPTAWSTGTTASPVFYGDDNARVVLATLAAARLLGEERWDARRAPLPARQPPHDRHASAFGETGSTSRTSVGSPRWEGLRDEPVVSYSPHFQAYLWAAWLWAYSLTGYEGFLEPTARRHRG